MKLTPIATFRSPLADKFGIPKQSGVVESLRGRIVFAKPYRDADYVRGIEEFDYLWLLWGFSANKHAAVSPVVRPPRLGGNAKMGVFATRSPYRPNAIGLSSVRLLEVERDKPGQLSLLVSGADLMDGTPIYDIKPYIEYADSHVGARSGFVDAHPWQQLRVDMPVDVAQRLTTEEQTTLKDLLAQDPRPHYQHQPGRVYGMTFGKWNVRFTIDDDTETVQVKDITTQQ